MDVGLKDLLRAGVHFGHQTHRWNPKMRKYIFAERGGIYLIDLKKTLQELERACELVRQAILDGKSVLFVCTKPQLAPVVRAEAERCEAFYVTERWLGGMLTNFQTIKRNVRRLKDLERGAEEGSFEFYTKKEQLLLEREREKLNRYLSGIKEMGRLPGVVFVVDAKKEEIAVREANRLEIPVVAIADTNADPDLLTVPIAGNDDAIRSVSLITRALADVIEATRREAPELRETDDEEEAYTYSTDAADVEDKGGRGRRKRPRRRPRPEAIAQRLHHPEVLEGSEDEGESEEEEADEGEAAGAEAATEPAVAEAGSDAEASAESSSGEAGGSDEGGATEDDEGAEETDDGGRSGGD